MTRLTMRTILGMCVVGTSGCVFSSGEHLVALGAQGQIPPDWEPCTNPRSSTPEVLQVNDDGWFLAMRPGKTTIQCKERTLGFKVQQIARIELEGPTAPVRAKDFLFLRAWGKNGDELSLFKAVGISWLVPPGARESLGCGHGSTFCDAQSVLGITGDPGTYRFHASYRGHKAWFDVTFERGDRQR